MITKALCTYTMRNLRQDQSLRDHGRGVCQMVPVRDWSPKLAAATVIHSRAPRSSGFGPALRSAARLVDRPIADSATATRNTDTCWSGLCAPAGITPEELIK